MPGRTPAAALDAYIGPLQRAVSCLGHAKITVTNPRPGQVGDEAMWFINGGHGIETAVGLFEGSQRFRLIEIPEGDYRRQAGRFRMKTLMYAYNLHRDDGTLSWHWHPQGNSDEQRPHMHLPIGPRGHYPTPRFSIEETVEWTIAQGAEPACEDWRDRLAISDALHKLHRSWADDPK